MLTTKSSNPGQIDLTTAPGKPPERNEASSLESRLTSSLERRIACSPKSSITSSLENGVKSSLERRIASSPQSSPVLAQFCATATLSLSRFNSDSNEKQTLDRRKNGDFLVPRYTRSLILQSPTPKQQQFLVRRRIISVQSCGRATRRGRVIHSHLPRMSAFGLEMIHQTHLMLLGSSGWMHHKLYENQK